jgi:hypothetical protein
MLAVETERVALPTALDVVTAHKSSVGIAKKYCAFGNVKRDGNFEQLLHVPTRERERASRHPICLAPLNSEEAPYFDQPLRQQTPGVDHYAPRCRKTLKQWHVAACNQKIVFFVTSYVSVDRSLKNGATVEIERVTWSDDRDRGS